MKERKHICIVGGGPAGMIAGLLFARAGVQTTVLEKHADFFRDFRGDTVHPSTLRLFSELGLLDRLLQRPHDKVGKIAAHVGKWHLEIADFTHFDSRWNYIAMMPQWEFLDFVAREAQAYPQFSLKMEAEALGFTKREGMVTGVRYRCGGKVHNMPADLVIASDGRDSVLRQKSGLALRSFGAPMDVFWFRIPKQKTMENSTTGIFTAGRIMALIDRGDYWQCAYVFEKGQAEKVQACGLDSFRAEVAQVAPMIADGVTAIASWDDVKLLVVALDRLESWHRPGLLVIGDAAHAMSPIGGVGINVAIQDAVAAANILAEALARGEDVDALLVKVQARRMLAVRTIQTFQHSVQKRIIGRLLAQTSGLVKPVLPLRLLNRYSWLRRIPAAFLGFGIRAEHIRSPKA